MSCALILTAICTAQNVKLDAFDAGHADIVLLQSKAVQKDIGLTKSQRDAMNVVATTHRKRMEAFGLKLQKQGKDPRTLARNDPTVAGYVLNLRKGVLGALTPKQLTRLRQLTLQRIGTSALVDAGVATRIGVNAPNLKKMRADFEAGRLRLERVEKTVTAPIMAKYKDVKPKSRAEAEQYQTEARQDLAAASAKAKPELEAISQDVSKRIMSHLTSTQKKSFQDLLGKPFRPS